MSKAATAAKKEYMRRWREKNPDKIKSSQNRYWDRVAKKNTAKEVQQAK